MRCAVDGRGVVAARHKGGGVLSDGRRGAWGEEVREQGCSVMVVWASGEGGVLSDGGRGAWGRRGA